MMSISRSGFRPRGGRCFRTYLFQSGRGIAEPREAVEGGKKLIPGAPLLGEGGATGRREGVEAAAALLGLFDPFALDHALSLQAMQHGVNGGNLVLQQRSRAGFDQFGELVAVSRLIFK